MATKQLRRSLAMLLFVTACQSTPATQVTVRVVPEDQALADDISRLRYQAAGPELSFVPVRYPFDIATVPANDLPADFRLEVTAELRDRSSITAVVTGAFVENEHREVVMV